MRKNSKQILKELYLELELSSLNIEERIRLDQALEAIQGNASNELKALNTLVEFSAYSDELYEYIYLKLTDKIQSIISVLSNSGMVVTISQFEESIKELEKSEKRYESIREQVKQRLH